MSADNRIKSPANKGFTIIEVLIVLAIAALILLIVFLAVPALQHRARDYSRKNYTSLVLSEMTNYYSNHGHFPGSAGGNPATSANQAEICQFLQSLPGADSAVPCGHSTASFSSINGSLAEDCTTVETGAYTVCYQNWLDVSHGYIGPYNEVSIMLAHWCNVGSQASPSQPASYPVAGNDSSTTRFVIWTHLESTQSPLCIDNSPSSF